MKAVELMIGDWVKLDFYDSPYADEEQATWKNGRIVTIRDDDFANIDFDRREFDIFLEDVQPIPISEEILIKSGFEEVNMENIYSVYRYGRCDVTPDIDWDGKLCWMVYVGSNDHDANICTHFVHELQHALRLLGINKDIEL